MCYGSLEIHRISDFFCQCGLCCLNMGLVDLETVEVEEVGTDHSALCLCFSCLLRLSDFHFLLSLCLGSFSETYIGIKTCKITFD